MHPERRKHLGELLGNARRRADRAYFEGAHPLQVSPRYRRRVHGPGLTQWDMDRLLGFAAGSFYGAFERGQIENPPYATLRQIGELLNLTDNEWEYLNSLLRNWHAPRSLHPGPSLPEGYEEMLNLYAGPAYANDVGWRVLARNKEADLLFPGSRMPENTMRWLLLDEDARSTYLPEWEDKWARRALPAVRAAWAAHPDNETLAELNADLLADPVVGPIYRGRLEPFVHSDTDLRPMVHGTTGERGRVRLHVMEPRGARGGAIVMQLVWIPDE
ncbi:XRE family transcriptional regulator [Streptomyces sp. NPDC020096]